MVMDDRPLLVMVIDVDFVVPAVTDPKFAEVELNDNAPFAGVAQNTSISASTHTLPRRRKTSHKIVAGTW
jgi:hypothetical protein